MEYKVKVELTGYDYDRFEISAANEKDAVMQAVKKFADEMKTDAPGALASGAITWTVEPVRAWMTAEEGINTLGASCTVWGFLNGSVLKCKSDFYGSLFFYDNDFQTSGSWDVANQPSHVMLRIVGEEPPEPPMIDAIPEHPEQFEWHVRNADEPQVIATGEKDAVLRAIERFVKDENLYTPGALASGAITWTVEPVREWMTAEEGLKSLKCFMRVWGFRDGKVMKWRHGAGDDYYQDTDETTYYDDIANPPSHVMLRIEGEEPPAPPEVEQVKEPTLYEQVKAICEGDGSAFDKYVKLFEAHNDITMGAVHIAGDNPFYSEPLDKSKFSCKLIMTYALQIAKSHENL